MKLLLCVDGSKESEKALDKAVMIASGCKADQVTVLNVFQKVTFPTFVEGAQQYDAEIMEMYSQMNEELIKEHEEILDRAVEVMLTHGIEVDRMLEDGHPAQIISRVAEDGDYDMVIMGSRGLSGLKKKLLGSVSNAVLQDTHTSVLVVK